MNLHLGCGSIRLPGFLNVDSRETEATDLVADCSDPGGLPCRDVGLAYSHAFFEHVFLAQRLPLLKGLREILAPSGVAVFLGIPDFRRVAEAYLAGGPGVLRPTFDLVEVYRYTHGFPELSPEAWLPMLHKSLFDVESLADLLQVAGFAHFSVFSYAFGDEGIALNLGFAAQRDPGDAPVDSARWLAATVGPLNSLIDLPSIRVRATCLPREARDLRVGPQGMEA